MAEGSFLVVAHFTECAIETVGDENRVITETVGPVGSPSDLPSALPGGGSDDRPIWARDSDQAHEPSRPVLLAIQQIHDHPVLLLVARTFSAESRRVHAGRSAECGYLKPRVVREHPFARLPGVLASFDHRVLLECSARLRRLVQQ